LRMSIAKEGSVPAFVVFSDAALVDMCGKHPYTAEEMLTVSGVGNVKLERYGERFLALLRGEERNTAPKEENLPQFTAELLQQEVEIEEAALPINRVADNVNAVLLQYGRPQTSGVKLNKLLLEMGFLEQTDDGKRPTESGSALGITAVRRSSERGDYTQCLYAADAQRMCVSLLLKEND